MYRILQGIAPVPDPAKTIVRASGEARLPGRGAERTVSKVGSGGVPRCAPGDHPAHGIPPRDGC